MMQGKRWSVAIITLGLLAGSVASAVAQDGAASTDYESFKTKQLEPGVLRVLDDNAGHDLTKKWPTRRREMNHIAVGPEGDVWLSIRASGDDNERLKGSRLWPLGQAATYGPKAGLGQHHDMLRFDEQGRLWVFGNRIATFDGEEWSSSKQQRSLVSDDGTVWLSGFGVGVESWDGTQLTSHLEHVPWTDRIFEGPEGTIGVYAWNGIYLYDGTEWELMSRTGRRAISADGVLAVLLADPQGMRLHQDGEVATVLEGNRLNEVVTAPDGSFWVAGRVGKSPGGVYRVDPTEVFAAATEPAEAATETDAATPAEGADGA